MSSSKRLIALLVLLLCASSARGVIAVTQARSNQAGGTSTSVTITTTANHLIVVIGYEDVSSSSTMGVGDSGCAAPCASYLQVGSTVTVGNGAMAMFYRENAPSVTSVQCTSSTSATLPCVVYEISGTASSGSLDGSATATASASGTTLTSGALTTTNTGSDILLYGMATGATQTAWTVGASHTIDAQGALPSSGQAINGRECMQRRIVSGVQSAVTTSTTPNSNGSDRIGIYAAFADTTITPGTGCKNRIALLGAGC